MQALAPDQAHFWATHTGAGIDLVIGKDGNMYGLEFKRADAPRATPSMRHALADLKLAGILVVYPGAKSYRIDAKILAVPLQELAGGKADRLLRFQ